MIACLTCHRELPEPQSLINGRVMGEDHTEAYYYCPQCDHFILALYLDQIGEESEPSLQGPLSHKEVAPKLAIIARCQKPTRVRCTCDAHREYFGGCLDS